MIGFFGGAASIQVLAFFVGTLEPANIESITFGVLFTAIYIVVIIYTNLILYRRSENKMFYIISNGISYIISFFIGLVILWKEYIF